MFRSDCRVMAARQQAIVCLASMPIAAFVTYGNFLKGNTMNAVLDWKTMPEGREKYAAYLASREWAVMKEQVKQRSRGTCEHCLTASGTQTHHQTYAHKYKELPEDLLHVCAPCHEFLSGKTTHNPANDRPLMVRSRMGEFDRTMKTVYLAGRITNSTWRDEIMPDWSRGDTGSCEPTGGWLPKEDAIIASGRSLTMTGPWWMDARGWGKHDLVHDNDAQHANGCFDNHGQLVADTGMIALNIVLALQKTDVVFAWLDSLECYGTLFEMGYANSRRCQVFGYAANEDIAKEAWLPLQMCNNSIHSQVQPSAGSAWKHFLANYTK